MRKALAAVIALLTTMCLLTGCGGAKRHVWLTHSKKHTFTACAGSQCGTLPVTMHWDVTIADVSGYYVFLNGTQIASTTQPEYTYSGLNCGGVTYTLGVEAHDNSSDVSQLYTDSYTTPSCSSSSNGLQVQGSELTDGGKTVVLHGVVQSGTEYMCSEGFGIFDNGDGTGLVDNTILPEMSSWDINSVLFGLNEDCWLGINGVNSSYSGQNYINAIKAAVTSAEANGLYPVIGFFWGDPGTEVSGGSDPNGGGQPAMPDNDHAPLFWQEVANTFKDDPNVIFRLQEEPHPNEGIGLSAWKCWSQGDVQYDEASDNSNPDVAPTPVSSNAHCNETATNGTTDYSAVGMQSLVNIIRGTGATNVIQLPGLGYANLSACSATGNPTTCGMLDSADGVRVTDPLASTPTGSQLMADFDMYPDQGQTCDTVTCYNDTLAPLLSVMPIDLGEIGPNNSTDTQANVLLNWMDTKDQSYYAWSWNTWSNLISSYSGTPLSPWGTDYFDRLTGYTPPPPAQPTGGITIRQASAQSCITSGHPTSGTVTLSQSVSAGDDLFLVVGGQGYTASAPYVTSVSDNVNGTWTQLTNSGSLTLDSTEYESYAVYELTDSKSAPSGLTITIGAVSGQSGLSAAAIDLGGVSGIGASAFTANPTSVTTFTSPTLSSVPAGDVVLGAFGGYSQTNQSFAAPTGFNTDPTYWTTSYECAAAAFDWEQPSSTGSTAAAITSTTSDPDYAGAIDLQ